MSYRHLSVCEREIIASRSAQGDSLSQIARLLTVAMRPLLAENSDGIVNKVNTIRSMRKSKHSAIAAKLGTNVDNGMSRCGPLSLRG